EQVRLVRDARVLHRDCVRLFGRLLLLLELVLALVQLVSLKLDLDLTELMRAISEPQLFAPLLELRVALRGPPEPREQDRRRRSDARREDPRRAIDERLASAGEMLRVAALRVETTQQQYTGRVEPEAERDRDRDLLQYSAGYFVESRELLRH